MFQNLNKTLADLDEQELVAESHANILDTEEDDFFIRLDESGIPLSENDDNSDDEDEDLDEIENEIGEDLDGDGDEGNDESDNSDEDDSDDEDDSSLFLDESEEF